MENVLCELFDVLGALEEQVINDWAHDLIPSERFAAFLRAETSNRTRS